jgi:hypothetical protein
MTHAEFHRRFEQGIKSNERSSILDLLVETHRSLVSCRLADFVKYTWDEQVWKFCDDILDRGEASVIFYFNGGISRVSVGWFQGRLTTHLTEDSWDKAKRAWNAETAPTP